MFEVNVRWYHFSPGSPCTLAAVEGVWTWAAIFVRGLLSPPVTNDGTRDVLSTQSSSLWELRCENLDLGHEDPETDRWGETSWVVHSLRQGWNPTYQGQTCHLQAEEIREGAGMKAGAWVQTMRTPPGRVPGSQDTEQNNFCIKAAHRSFFFYTIKENWWNDLKPPDTQLIYYFSSPKLCMLFLTYSACSLTWSLHMLFLLPEFYFVLLTFSTCVIPLMLQDPDQRTFSSRRLP